MKLAGIVIINAVLTILGFSSAFSIKAKEKLCGELVEMASFIRIELNYSLSSCESIINTIKKEKAFKRLDFINDINFENVIISTRLSQEENERIEQLFNKLGNVDLPSMLEMLSVFEEYFAEQKKRYANQYQRSGKLYAAMGALGGAAFSLMII